MKTYKIAVIAGDGIAPEVLAEGIKVLNKVSELDGGFSFEFTYFPWGCEYYLVDVASMFFVKDPKRFEIVVTSNLFGDIITDLGAAISGGIGLAAGANLNPGRKFPSMFEPIHGSAPDIAGKQIANPLASIWSASQVLDFFGHEDWGKKLIDAIEIIDAIEKIMVDGKILTPDMGGNSTTAQVGDELVKLL